MGAMVPPGLEKAYALIRSLPLFEGIPDQDLHRGDDARAGSRTASSSATCSCSIRSALAGGAACAGRLRRARPGRRRGVQRARARRERRAAADRARERDEGRARGRVADQAAAARAHRAQERRAVHGGRPVQLRRALGGARPADGVLHGGAVACSISLDHRWIAELAVRHPPFEARLRRALSVSRERLAWVSGVKQELLDFFVRQGISVSGEMVRVRQLGLCIDCKLCEEACEERYGARRLTLGGYQLGMLDFIYTCRTCTDQRCIDPCAYDSIKFDDAAQGGRHQRGDAAPAAPRARRRARTARSTWSRSSPTRRRSRRTSRRASTRSDALKFGPGTGRVARAAPDREQVRSLHRVRRSGVRVGVPDRLADRDQRVRSVPRALAGDGAARAPRLRRTT